MTTDWGGRKGGFSGGVWVDESMQYWEGRAVGRERREVAVLCWIVGVGDGWE